MTNKAAWIVIGAGAVLALFGLSWAFPVALFVAMIGLRDRTDNQNIQTAYTGGAVMAGGLLLLSFGAGGLGYIVLAVGGVMAGLGILRNRRMKEIKDQVEN